MKINSGDFSIDGTFLQGEIKTSFQSLRKIFGDPLVNEPGDKVQAEWNIRFEDGTVATVYDWKEWGDYKKVQNRHIGGYNNKAVQKVKMALSIP